MQIFNPCKKCIVRPSCPKKKYECFKLYSYYKFINLLNSVAAILIGGVVVITISLANEGIRDMDPEQNILKYAGVALIAAISLIICCNYLESKIKKLRR